MHAGGISPPLRALPVAATKLKSEKQKRREVIMAAKRPDFPAWMEAAGIEPAKGSRRQSRWACADLATGRLILEPRAQSIQLLD